MAPAGDRNDIKLSRAISEPRRPFIDMDHRWQGGVEVEFSGDKPGSGDYSVGSDYDRVIGAQDRNQSIRRPGISQCSVKSLIL